MSVFGNILLITGIPGIGKTTVIKKAIKKIPDTHIEGFYTEEIRSHNVRQGFVILPLSLNGMGSILSVRKPALKKDDQGVVEFKATSFSQKKIWRLHEVSRFVKEEGQWFYVIGDIKGETSPVKKPPRVGRNEPCSCGSGKKFKKCCGS